jgi:hypothetical protein
VGRRLDAHRDGQTRRDNQRCADEADPLPQFPVPSASHAQERISAYGISEEEINDYI